MKLLAGQQARVDRLARENDEEKKTREDDGEDARRVIVSIRPRTNVHVYRVI